MLVLANILMMWKICINSVYIYFSALVKFTFSIVSYKVSRPGISYQAYDDLDLEVNRVLPLAISNLCKKYDYPTSNCLSVS